MKQVVLLLAVVMSVVSLGAHAQSVYRWVDKDGKVFYSDTPPPADVKNVQQKRLGSGVTIDQEQLPYAVKLAIEKNPVVLYTSACGEPCTGARALLAKRGIVYTERDPEKNPADGVAFKKISSVNEVPVLTIGDRVLKGLDPDTWNSALDAAGYPSSNPFTTAPEPKKAEPAKTAADSSKAAPSK